ncbi:flagellar protein FlaG [Magnetofaba australis]|uniref:flagellar protein FlaG n=1 Tax=Magnetofaba australis TaxID=1472297 RepID=UPI0018E9DA9E|nr:flagellar protein FlaG [Magnetofaba australis]
MRSGRASASSTTASASTNPPSRAESQTPGRAALEQAVEQAQRAVNGFTRLQFSIEEETEDVVVRVVDRETDEVIRQIPSEEMVNFAKRMQDWDGLLFDAQA